MKKLSIILLILWMILIFVLSSAEATVSSSQSNVFVDLVVSVIGNADRNIVTFIIRKLAHFSLYLVLGILVINVCRYYNPKNIILLSLLFCMAYACSDEIHQLFVLGRSGEVRDVLIDSTGSLIGIYCYHYFRLKKK